MILTMVTSSKTNQPTGLVSVTFRQLSPEEIVQLARKNGLELIEWGGDVHVPPGDISRAAQVRTVTRDAGLGVAAYGSYYRIGVSEAEGLSFANVLKTAAELGAPVIRVWAGNKGSDVADDTVWESVIDDARRIAAMAAAEGIKVALEFHGNTLNDTPAASRQLWHRLEGVGLLSLWQPLPTLNRADQDKSLMEVLPRLSHVHVFQWRPGPPITRHRLEEGRSEWSEWLSVIQKSGRQIPALLEFVENDDPALLPVEAATLHSLLGRSS
jgi:sugar phosphate isomerase/epimerase